MKRFSEQLKNRANTVKLRVAEKSDLRDRIVSYMEYHPMPVSLRQKGETAAPQEVRLVHVSLWRMFQLSGAALGVLLLSISYLAERAVPGDSLYSVKVRFNEEVRSTLARGPYEKVVWETERLNRRIAEARLLASEGRLTEEAEEEVANAVRVHSDNARREIEVLKQTDVEEAALASIQLATAIEVQSSSLKNNDVASTTEGKSTAKIAGVLAETQETEAGKEDNTLPSYEKLMGRVEIDTTRAYELLRNINRAATPEEKADIQRRLEDIERAVSASVAQFDTDNILSRQQLVESLQRTQRLIVFMTNIDVRTSMTVEQIVPVTLTTEERVAKVKKTAEETLALLKLADSKLATTSASTSEEVRAKLLPAISSSTQEATEVLDALAVSGFDLEALEQKIKNAYAIADDAATLLSIEKSSITLPEIKVPEPEVATSTATSTEEVNASSTDSATGIEV